MSTERRLSKMEQKVEDLCNRVDAGFARVENKLDNFVTHDEFDPVRTVVYGMVGTILLAFLGGLCVLVFGA